MEEKHKAKRIMNELLNYFFENEIESIRMGLEFAENGFYIEMQGSIPEEPASLSHFVELLSIERDPNMEDYYEALSGEHHETDDYVLLGLMVDDVEVFYDSPTLDIKIFRKK